MRRERAANGARRNGSMNILEKEERKGQKRVHVKAPHYSCPPFTDQQTNERREIEKGSPLLFLRQRKEGGPSSKELVEGSVQSWSQMVDPVARQFPPVIWIETLTFQGSLPNQGKGWRDRGGGVDQTLRVTSYSVLGEKSARSVESSTVLG